MLVERTNLAPHSRLQLNKKQTTKHELRFSRQNNKGNLKYEKSINFLFSAPIGFIIITEDRNLSKQQKTDLSYPTYQNNAYIFLLESSFLSG